MQRPSFINHGSLLPILILIEQIANRELARKVEIEKKLDYIARELARVNIIKKLPNNDVEFIALAYRVMDVRSAVITYIAVHIRRESNMMGIMGKLIAFSLCRSHVHRKYCHDDLQGG